MNKLFGGFLITVAGSILVTCIYFWTKKDTLTPTYGYPADVVKLGVEKPEVIDSVIAYSGWSTTTKDGILINKVTSTRDGKSTWEYFNRTPVPKGFYCDTAYTSDTYGTIIEIKAFVDRKLLFSCDAYIKRKVIDEWNEDLRYELDGWLDKDIVNNLIKN